MKRQILSKALRHSAIVVGSRNNHRRMLLVPSSTQHLSFSTLSSSSKNTTFSHQHHMTHHHTQQQQQQRYYASNMTMKAVGMLGSVSSKIKNVMDSLNRKKFLTQNDVNAAMSNVRLALIQSDVSQIVVDEFIAKLKNEIVGQKVVDELPKAATVYALVQKHLTDLLGTEHSPLNMFLAKTSEAEREQGREKGKISVILVAGTQGSGKTTTCAKLVQYARSNYQLINKQQKLPQQETSDSASASAAVQNWNQRELKPFLISLDTYRPAAMQQLERLAQQIDAPSLPINSEETNPVSIIKHAWDYLEKEMWENDARNDWLIVVDTAGRMQIDTQMMDEIKQVHDELLNRINHFSSLKYEILPSYGLETLLVADAMLGNEAVNIAKQFHENLGLSGIVLTRLDGDARGGAAISMKARTGVPIKLIGTGEGLNALDIFDPRGMADRIMGQGDIGAMTRRVMSAAGGDDRFSPEALKATMGKISKTGYDFAEYLKMTQMFKKMGGMASMASYMPGEIGQKMQQYSGALENIAGEETFATHGAIISHMTPDEVSNPQIIKSSSARRIQIARSANVDVIEVNKMLKMFDKMRSFYETMAKKGTDMSKFDGPDGFAKMQEMFTGDPELMKIMKPKTKRIMTRR